MKTYLHPGDIVVYWNQPPNKFLSLKQKITQILVYFKIIKVKPFIEDFEGKYTSGIYGGLDEKHKPFIYIYKGHEVQRVSIHTGDQFTVYNPINGYHQKEIINFCENWDKEEIIYFKEFLRVDSFYPKRERNFAFLIYTASSQFQLNPLTCHEHDIDRWLNDAREFKNYQIYYANRSSRVTPDFIYNHLYYWYELVYKPLYEKNDILKNEIATILSDIDELMDDFELSIDDQLKIINEVLKSYFKDKLYDLSLYNAEIRIHQHRLFEQLELILKWLNDDNTKQFFHQNTQVQIFHLLADAMQSTLETIESPNLDTKINALNKEKALFLKRVLRDFQERLLSYDNAEEGNNSKYIQLCMDLKNMANAHKCELGDTSDINSTKEIIIWSGEIIDLILACSEHGIAGLERPQHSPLWSNNLLSH